MKLRPSYYIHKYINKISFTLHSFKWIRGRLTAFLILPSFGGVGGGFEPALDADTLGSALEEVVVTERLATRAIVDGQRLKGKQLERLSNNSVADALRYFSGMQIKDYGGVGGLKTVNIRSMGTHHVGVFYDGIELSNAQNGVIDLGQFSLDNVDEISLYNGQKSQIFQPAADFGNAGSVYIRTRRPLFTDKPYHLKFRLKGGSADMIRCSALWDQRISPTLSSSLNVEFLNSSGKYKFSYRRKRLDGAIAYDTTAVRQNGDIWAVRAEGNLHGTIGRGGWNVKLYTYQSQRGIPGAIVNNVWKRGERQGDSNYFIQGTWQKSVTDHYDTQLRAKYAFYDTRYINRDTTIMQVDNRYRQHEAYISTANAYEIKPWWTASLSYDFRWNKLVTETFATPAQQQPRPMRITNMLAAATAFDFQWVKLQGSLLATWVSDWAYGNASALSSSTPYLSPAFYATIKPFRSDLLSIDLFAKRSVRMPTFNDLYYTEAGNAALNPEKANQYNIGMKLHPTRGINPENTKGVRADFRATVSAYYNTVRDKIVAYPKGQQFRWTMLNLGKVHIKGIEASVQTTVAIYSVILSLTAQYTYQEAKDITDPNTSYYNHQIPYIPWHSGSAVLNASWRDLSLNYSFIYSGKRYSSQENILRNEMQPWYTSDLSLTYRLHRFLFTAEVNNLLSQDYDVIINYPMPKRNYALTVAVEL